MREVARAVACAGAVTSAVIAAPRGVRPDFLRISRGSEPTTWGPRGPIVSVANMPGQHAAVAEMVAAADEFGVGFGERAYFDPDAGGGGVASRQAVLARREIGGRTGRPVGFWCSPSARAGWLPWRAGGLTARSYQADGALRFGCWARAGGRRTSASIVWVFFCFLFGGRTSPRTPETRGGSDAAPWRV